MSDQPNEFSHQSRIGTVLLSALQHPQDKQHLILSHAIGKMVGQLAAIMILTQNRPAVTPLSLMLARIAEILLGHTNDETLELDTTTYYQRLIEVFSEPDFHQVLNIATVFPGTQFYGFHACFGDAESLCFKKITEPLLETDFWLIVRTHEHKIDILRDYLVDECEAYNICTIQENEILFIGIASLPPTDRAIVVFLSVSIATLESRKQELERQSPSMKATLFDKILSIVRQVHREKICGFDLHPSNIFVTNGQKRETAFLLGFVGGSEVFEKYPAQEDIRWNTDALPQLASFPFISS
jgi:hypothetical protein